MNTFSDAAAARDRARWLRADAHLWRRPDAHRYDRPDAARVLRPDWERHVEAAFIPFYRAQFDTKANFNSNQPRVPKGNPEGGQWSRDGGGSLPVGHERDIDGSGGGAGYGADESELPGQLVYLGPAIRAARVVKQGLEAGLAFFTWLSARNGLDGAAILALPAEDFRLGSDPSSPLVYVGRLTNDELSQACPRIGEVQSLTDRAAAAVRRADYASPATYGTAVHIRLRDNVRAMYDPDLIAEVSLLKTLQETRRPVESDVRYGQRGSIRIDVLENAGEGTVCVYDIKTGASGLSRARVAEMARSVYLHYPFAQRIVVTETRPRR